MDNGELNPKFKIDGEVSLRPFEASDAADLYSAVRQNYEHLRTYMHWMVPDYSLQSASDFIADSNTQRINGENLGFGIFRNGMVIGSIGFVYFDRVARRTEIGYWISRSEEGKGIITRSCKILIDYAFDDSG